MSHVVVQRLLVAGLGVLLVSANLLAQASERVLYVTALDEQTKAPVESLGAADIRVTEDDRAREVLRVTPATTPMPIAVMWTTRRARRHNRRPAHGAHALPVGDRRPRARGTHHDRGSSDHRAGLHDGRREAHAGRQPDFLAARFRRDAPGRDRRGVARPGATRGRSRGDRARHDRAHRVQHAALLAGPRRVEGRRRDAERGRAREPAVARTRPMPPAIARWSSIAASGTAAARAWTC